MSRCKCPKSDAKANEPPSLCFEDLTTRMEERRCDLLGRQKYLTDKITTMERSIPALIAYNMWMSKKCQDAPYCKVREIMRRFSPYPDQTERLLKDLKKTVKELNGETTELHEKIIQADVELEETDMQLESLELMNKEMTDTVKKLEKEVRSYTTPSLHSIHSEDLICLSKVRQLAEEELNLKNCIKELEQRETIFKDHMDRLLMSKEYQNMSGKRKLSCAQDLECNAMKICCVPKKCLLYLPNDHRPKKKQAPPKTAHSDAVVSTSEQNISSKQEQEGNQENVEKKSSWIPNWWNNNDKAEKDPSQTKSATLSNAGNNELEGSAMLQNSEKEAKEENKSNDKLPKQSKSKSSNPSSESRRHSSSPPATSTKLPRSPPSTGPRDRQSATKKSCPGKNPVCDKQLKGFSRNTPSRKGCCSLPPCAPVDHGIRKSCKPILIPPCDLRSLCDICPSPCKDLLRPRGNCRCNCRGKCAQGLSDTECNCSDSLEPSEEYRPLGLKQLDSCLEDSNSEDEYCECCSCGCEDSDASLPCQCN